MIKLFILLLFVTSAIAETQKVKIGAYPFPPYVEVKDNKITGVLPEIIDILNESQTDFHFSLVLTSAKRRYVDFKKSRFDLMLFEDLSWGWEEARLKDKLQASSAFLKSGEVFITAKTKGKDDSFFKVLKNKTKIGMLGYHYKFAAFNSDKAFLKYNHYMTVTDSHESIMKTILNDRKDIGIISKDYLNLYFEKNPETKKQILASSFYDQDYNHRIIYPKDSKIVSKKIVEDLIAKLKKNSKFQSLKKRLTTN